MPPEPTQTEAGKPTPTTPDPLVTVTPAEVVVDAQPLAPTEPRKAAASTPEATDAKVYEVPESEFKRLKEKAQEKGRKAAIADLAAKAREAGFESPEEAFASLAEMRDRIAELTEQSTTATDDDEDDQMTTPSKTKKPSNNNGKRNNRPGRPERQQQSRRDNVRGKEGRVEAKSAKEIVRLERERTKAKEQWRKEEKRRKVAERRLAAKEAEIEIRQIAVQEGVKDVDYALRLLTRDLVGKSMEDLAAFSEKEFFAGLKQTKPYLFGEKNVPATTGTGAGDEDTPPEPNPGEVRTTTAESQHFDAREAKPEDVKARLRELGLSTTGNVSHK